MILTIAIPTWNRAKTLNVALSLLLPQVVNQRDNIELIVSDNASTDNTSHVIAKWKEKYSQIFFKTYRQKTNLGFYGNFMACKKLSSGKYFWLLSDDDHIRPSVIDSIIGVLRSSTEDIGMIYLENTLKKRNKIITKDIISIFSIYNLKLTFTSTSIFYNIKNTEEYLTKCFYKSSLFGFVLLADVFRFKKNGIIMHGNFLDIGKDIPKGYNWFEAFIFDLFKITEYMKNIGYPPYVLKKIENNLIKKSIMKRYFYLKAHQNLDGGLESFPIFKVDNLLYDKFRGNYLYWLYLFPIRLLPTIIIKKSFPFINYIRKKIKN